MTAPKSMYDNASQILRRVMANVSCLPQPFQSTGPFSLPFEGDICMVVLESGLVEVIVLAAAESDLHALTTVDTLQALALPLTLVATVTAWSLLDNERHSYIFSSANQYLCWLSLHHLVVCGPDTVAASTL